MNKKRKVLKLAGLVILMLGYIVTVFYLSEPKFIDNYDKRDLQRFDWVSIPKYSDEVVNGIIVQRDQNKAQLKVRDFMMGSDLYELDIKSSPYRVIGRGTIYHKVNEYVGFNIIMITQIFIGILCAALMIQVGTLLYDLIIKED